VPNVLCPTTTGELIKKLGGTNLASVGYSISPRSSEAAKAAAISAQLAGLQVGYLNTKFPFGDTNVGPAVLAMKQAGSTACWPTSNRRPPSPSSKV
jgi:branched-chain amino acid transport system substrate-binding protein